MNTAHQSEGVRDEPVHPPGRLRRDRARGSLAGPSGRGERAGGAGFLLLVLLALLVAILLWSLGETISGAGPEAAPGPEASVPATAEPVRPLAPPALPGPGLTAGGPRPAAASRDATPSDEEFEGRGRIRGEVQLAPGVVWPQRWTIHAVPSRIVRGREHAVPAHRELSGDTRAFDLDGLALGGYDVFVEGAGITSDRVPVLLVRGSPSAFVNLLVRPRGFLEGFVRDTEGRLIEGLLIVIESRGSGKRLSARTDPSGRYVFEDLPDGEYRLLLGSSNRPLVPPLELSFRGPSMRVPVQEVPPLGTLVVHAVDRLGYPLSGVRVQGYGSEGGTIDTVTDDLGEARALALPPGRFRLRLRHEDGREGRAETTVVGGQQAELYVALKE